MSSTMTHNSYGKSRVRLTKVVRHPDHHELREVSIDIQLEGDFEASYTRGDNSKVVATDSMKNTVYVLAANHAFPDIETFGSDLANHFLKTYDQVSSAEVELQEARWLRIEHDGQPHPHAFVSGGEEMRTAGILCTRDSRRIESGIEDLIVLKTTASEFWGFIRDQYTTLPEVRDRIFATSMSARWYYKGNWSEFNSTHQRVRTLMLEVFARHHSLAVQQTMYEMGEEILMACPEIE